MAKLTLTVDTETGSFEVAINGEAVENATDVSARAGGVDYDGEPTSPSFYVYGREKKGDHHVSTTICASDAGHGETAAQRAIASMWCK